MFYFPIFIHNRRYHYCKLLPTVLSERDVEFQFVIAKSIGARVTLFRISEGTNFLSNRKSGDDIEYSPKEIDLEVKAEDGQNPKVNLSFKIRERKDGNKSFDTQNDTLKALGLSFEYRDEELFLLYEGAVNKKSFQIEILLYDRYGEAFSSTFTLHIGPADFIYDAVFDFGSEASQIAIRKRSDGFEKTRRIDLLGGLLRNFYLPSKKSGKLSEGDHDPSAPAENLRNNDYRKRFTAHNDEQTRKAKELFLSSFFVRREYKCNGEEKVDSIEQMLVRPPFYEGDQEWVSLTGDVVGGPRYINNKARDGYEMVSNLKLTELEIAREFSLCIHGVEKEITDREIQEVIFRRLMVQFLHLLLAEQENTLKPQADKLLKLTLLVPNIYSQKRVNSLIRTVYADLQRIITENGYKYSGFEVQTLSESDASFLGMLSNSSIANFKRQTLKPNGNYLVIDAGRGTTDLSLISMGDDKQLGSVFRGGFAGAGNAISYAFFETIIAQIAGDSRPERERLTEQVLKMPIGDKYRFFKKLEQLKKLYNKNGEDDYSYSDDEFRKLDFSFSGTNRLEFLLDDLETLFIAPKKSLKDHFGIIGDTLDMIASHVVKLVERTGVDHFDKIILSGRSFLMDELREKLISKLRSQFNIDDVLFAERDLKKSCLFGPLAVPEGTNYNSDLVGTPVKTTPSGLAITLADRIRRRKPRTEKRTATNLHDGDFYLGGIMVTPEDHLSVCGRDINMPIFDEDEINVVYVGDGFLARTETICKNLEFSRSTEQDVDSDPLAWMSLFPYVDPPVVVSPVTIPWPKVSPTPKVQENPVEEKRSLFKAQAVPVVVPPQPSVSVPKNDTTAPDPDDDMWEYI